jgi:GNAT superfamily N-acetyltransferase
VPIRGEVTWLIRTATAADADAVTEVLTAAGVAAWGPFLGADLIEAANRGRQHPADLVAVDSGGVFAFVAWDGATGEILRLYTHPRASGRGAGTALLDRALAALRETGCTRAWLNTEARNLQARRFYERNGWRVEGPARERVWHGAQLSEPRYVIDLCRGSAVKCASQPVGGSQRSRPSVIA